jgi:hypothetical protein
MLVHFPPVTPESLYKQDTLRRERDEEERYWAAYFERKHRQEEEKKNILGSPQLAREVLEQVSRVLDNNHVPRTRGGRVLDLSQRVKLLEVAAEHGEA